MKQRREQAEKRELTSWQGRHLKVSLPYAGKWSHVKAMWVSDILFCQGFTTELPFPHNFHISSFSPFSQELKAPVSAEHHKWIAAIRKARDQERRKKMEMRANRQKQAGQTESVVDDSRQDKQGKKGKQSDVDELLFGEQEEEEEEKVGRGFVMYVVGVLSVFASCFVVHRCH